MHFSALLTLGLTTLTAALPNPAPLPAAAAFNEPAGVSPWQITSMKRTCLNDNSACTYSFGILTSQHPLQQCAYQVSGTPASQSPVNGIVCGVFTLSSGWSDQFGKQSGFTTFSVTDGKYISWPAYADSELATGQLVVPDRSFKVYTLV